MTFTYKKITSLVLGAYFDQFENFKTTNIWIHDFMTCRKKIVVAIRCHYILLLLISANSHPKTTPFSSALKDEDFEIDYFIIGAKMKDGKHFPGDYIN